MIVCGIRRRDIYLLKSILRIVDKTPLVTLGHTRASMILGPLNLDLVKGLRSSMVRHRALRRLMT